jgi:hypothetical protein
VDAEQRAEVQRMIDYTIAMAVTPALADIRNRVIGIDGNGTGHSGALQRLEVKVIEGFDELTKAVEALQTSNRENSSISKVKLWHVVAAAITLAVTFALTTLGQWIIEMLKHANGWK